MVRISAWHKSESDDGLRGLLSPARGETTLTSLLRANETTGNLRASLGYVLGTASTAKLVTGGVGGSGVGGAEVIDFGAVAEYLQSVVQPEGPSLDEAQPEAQPADSQQAGCSDAADVAPVAAAAADTAAAPAAESSSGRLGPAEVALVAVRGEVDITKGTWVLGRCGCRRCRAQAFAMWRAGQLAGKCGGHPAFPTSTSPLPARFPTAHPGCCRRRRSNFSTVRSNACVFKGHWQYEVQLGSSGIMQLGWTTLQARFTSEEGVGDNQDR